MAKFRFVPLEDVDVNTLINIDGKDLGQLTVRKCDKRSLSELADSMKGKIRPVKMNKSKAHKQKTDLAR
jgi:hypothetical protein